jgi:DNA polymerase I-like protein with 3'-5' exonuclease and polymerase domains
VEESSPIHPGAAKHLYRVADALGKAPATERHVKSLWGLRRCFYHEGSSSDREKRQLKNAVAQMLEADVLKITVLELHRTFKASGIPFKIILLLHDGIWFACSDHRATVARVAEEIRKIMENSVRLSVPFKVELSCKILRKSASC